jgi:hypothetical protein
MADSYGKTNLQPGFRLFDGSALNTLLSKVLQGGLSRKNGITAHAGGTKAAAFQLTTTISRISVCATDHDSVLLPKAIAGSEVTVINSGAALLDVYGKGTDTIDAVNTATANTIATTKAKKYTCVSTGFWHTTSAT